MGALINTGHACTAATRLYVERSRFDDTVDSVVSAFQEVNVEDPWDDETSMGPLISVTQRERVSGFVERAKGEGAKVVLGGGVPSGMDKGYYYAPTVIVDAGQKSDIVQQEVFAPLVVLPFDGETQAIDFGNDVLYGRAASVWTKDIGRAIRMASALEFGTVWINDHLPLASEGPTEDSSSPASGRTSRWNRCTTTPSPSM